MPQTNTQSVLHTSSQTDVAPWTRRRPPGFLLAGLLWACVLWLGGQALAGSILREVFQGIGGSSVADLTNSPAFPSKPSATNLVTTFFEAPTDVDENYGQRMHGYVVPPVTGNYTFWIASDDGSSLYLSTDENPANVRLVAYVAAWTASREWTKEPNQQSAPVRLEAGRGYYISALQKEGGGGDNLAVRWLRPDGVDEGPIPATYLQPWGISFTPPVIVQQPTNTTAIEGQYATFNVGTKNFDSVAVWRRNGTPIPSTGSLTLVYGPVTLDDQGAVFSAYLTNRLGNVTSQGATLTVLPDTTPPRVLDGINQGSTGIVVNFSEPVTDASGANPANYTVSGGVTVTGATLRPDRLGVLLAVSPLTFGVEYTVAVQQVVDLARTPNRVAAGSQVRFTARELVSQDVGTSGGSIQRLDSSRWNLTGGGADIGGTADQFQYAWEQRSGNFDIQVRVDTVDVTDPFVHAGLMARASLATNAAFVATFAASPQVGSFLESRGSTGAAALTAAPVGGFPVNPPQTWLRLRKVGNVFTGFGSLDGQTWVQLGTATVTLPSNYYLGMAFSAGTGSQFGTAQFRDYGTTVSAATGTYTPTREPLGPASRRTGIVFSEVMYHAKGLGNAGRSREFVELYNADTVFEELGGWRITGDIDYQFPPGFVLRAGEFVAIAADPAALSAASGASRLLGPYLGTLGRNSGTLRLLDTSGAVKLEFTYDTEAPWPVAPDGSGHSLTLVRPSYGLADPRAWGSSEQVGGSPGRFDTVVRNPWSNVVLNEFLALPDPATGTRPYLELYNHGTTPVDLGGCFLSNDPLTNRFRIPDGTVLPAQGFLAFDAARMGFAPSPAGDTLYLVDPTQTRVVDVLRFQAQERGVASGRSPDGADTVRRLASPTPGQANGPWRVEDLVINELMYAPISRDSDDEYVEILNRGTNTVDLTDWRLASAVSFRFPAGTALAPGGYLVVGRNIDRLRANYPQLQATNSLGNYNGSLGNSGDRLRLTRPQVLVTTNDLGDVSTNVVQCAVVDVAYGAGGRWGKYSDGGGSSLELLDPRADPLRPSSWADSDETQKSAWNTYTVTGTLTQGMDGYPPNRLHLGMLGMGEVLIDDVEVLGPAGTNQVANAGFETGTSGWSFFGNHSTTTVDSSGAATGNRCLHIRAQGDNDTANNSIRTPILGTLASGNRVTLRVKARWLAGWPEVLLRLRGNWMELPARLDLPTNLGTPGLPNSRAVANAGPAIYAVNHTPALPRANQPVVVTCRASDPDGIGTILLRYRTDPGTTLASLPMRDDGTGGDAVAGDGIYSATLTGKAGGTLVGFSIVSTDAASQDAATASFPGVALIPFPRPSPECLIRWDDPIPTGNFAHYHLWSSAATENLRQGSSAMNNTYREATLVYGNSRVIYQAGFRDKGSPFHGGGGSFAVMNPDDEPLLGVTERVLRATGNGGSESTGLRNTTSAWIGKQMGIPYLHVHYMQLYRNGGQFNNLTMDAESPSNDYANGWFPKAGGGDLYKIAIWFEFQDDNSGFGATGATLEDFRLANKVPNRARYRWNWQTRAYEGTANNYTNIFNLVALANDTSTNFVPNLTRDVDVDEWMHVFAFHRVLGNWDSYTFNVGQNMYLFRSPTQKYVILPWDIDFTLGDGNGPSDGLWGGQDPVVNRWYDTPAIRRMLWRAYQEAIAGPLDPARYGPMIEARRASLAKNGIAGLAAPTPVLTYLAARRAFLQQQLTANDVTAFGLTTPASSTVTKPLATIQGKAPFAVASILVNGVEYPTTWTTQNTFSIGVPLTTATNVLALIGVGRDGQPVAGATATVNVRYTGAVQRPQDFLVLNEIHYNPVETNASFVEIYNASTLTPFDLSGWRLEGVGATLPDGTVLAPGAYGVLAKNRLALNAAYGTAINVLGEFPGSLRNGGEFLRLVKPFGLDGTNDLVISDVRYDQNLPWPTNANGFGPSLQLIDALQGSYRVANWATAATNATIRSTPGKANSVRTTLPTFPTLWINEVLPANVDGPKDGRGERDPYIELHNYGSTPVDLSGLLLSDTYTNLLRWTFPAGATVAPGGFVVVWADGQPEQSTATEFHAGFRLAPTTGTVALSWIQSGEPAVLDHVAYDAAPPGRSLGCIPDGEPRNRRWLYRPTLGAANDPAYPKVAVTLNEFLADNVATLVNPATGKADDWLELHNAGTDPVDLTGYTMTDELSNPSKFRIPGGFILPPGGLLLAWADKATAANTNRDALHLSFRLSKGGGFLGLFAPDGARVDGVTYGAQSTDISQGRLPDGGDLPLVTFSTPTPGASNDVLGGNQSPILSPLATVDVDEQQLVSFTAQATDPDAGQVLRFSLPLGGPAGAELDPVSGRFLWTPNESQGPASYNVAVRVTDNGTPPRSATQRVTINVREANQAPVLPALEDRSVDEGSLLAFTVVATDPDIPANTLRYALADGAPAGAQIDPVTGAFAWRPSEEQGPATHAITVVVTDNGVPAREARRTFQVTVNEVNNPPVLAPIAPQSVAEGSAFELAVVAHDPDQPPAGLVYSLDGEVPAGLRIDPATGLLRWTPTEAQGPATYVVVVRVTEQDARRQSTTQSFGITVTEVNQRPTLTPVAPVTVREGDPVVVALTATDSDLPRQSLTYSLGAGADVNASIDPRTGVFTWTPPLDIGASTNRVTVRVADDGPGALEDSTVLTVVTLPRFRAVINEVLYRPEATNSAFVELHNPSAVTSQDLTGVRLLGENLRYAFPAGTRLAPGAFLVLAKDRTAFGKAFPGVTVFDQWSGNLDRFNTRLTLERTNALGQIETLQQVDYRASLPWPVSADVPGSSLQLRDARRDGSRVGNWSAGSGVGWQHVVQTGTASSSTLYLYLESVGSVHVDDIQLVAGDVAEVGPNLMPNGDFEGAFPGALTVSANLATSAIVTSQRHGGSSSLKMVSTSPGTTRGSSIWLDFNPGLTANATYTLSYWYLPDPAGGTLTLRLSGSGIKSTVNIAPNVGAVAQSTPGTTNSVVRDLSEFPPVWINEVAPDNRSGRVDASGVAAPWIELVNTGPLPVEIGGWALAPTYAPLDAWVFPAGTRVPANGFLLVFADGLPAKGTPEEWHAGFRLPATNGAVVLSRLQGTERAVVDYLEYDTPGVDASIGLDPSDFPWSSLRFGVPTPEAPNRVAIVAPVVVAGRQPNGDVQIQWPTQAGVVYRVEVRNGWDSPWQVLREFTADGTPASVTEATTGLGARFYRVVAP